MYIVLSWLLEFCSWFSSSSTNLSIPFRTLIISSQLVLGASSFWQLSFYCLLCAQYGCKASSYWVLGNWRFSSLWNKVPYYDFAAELDRGPHSQWHISRLHVLPWLHMIQSKVPEGVYSPLCSYPHPEGSCWESVVGIDFITETLRGDPCEGFLGSCHFFLVALPFSGIWLNQFNIGLPVLIKILFWKACELWVLSVQVLCSAAVFFPVIIILYFHLLYL